jgi:hypothetical protein
MLLTKHGRFVLSGLGTAGVMSLMVAGLPGDVQAASLVTGVSPALPGDLVSPGAYDVFLEAGDPLSVTVDVTVPTAPNTLDLFLLQDLSSSFTNDLQRIRNNDLIPDLVSGVSSQVGDVRYGVGSFIDKPFTRFGNTTDYVYQTELAITDDVSLLEATYDSLAVRDGRSIPEAQLSALLQTAVRASSIGFRDSALRVAVLLTDAPFHEAGDFDEQPANNGDAVLDGDPPGSGEDYPSREQVEDALRANNIVPIFATTSDVRANYEALVDEWGFGAVVDLASDSSNLVDAVLAGLDDVFRDITLFAEGDDFGYVQGITPADGFKDVPEGETRTFSIELLADGVDDADDTLSLVAPGYGSTIVNVDVVDGDLPSDSDGDLPSDPEKVPEPATAAGLALVGILGLMSSARRKKRGVF